MKITRIDVATIEALEKLGFNRFHLIGEEIWGPRNATFQLRAERMKKVAARLGLDGS